MQLTHSQLALDGTCDAHPPCAPPPPCRPRRPSPPLTRPGPSPIACCALQAQQALHAADLEHKLLQGDIARADRQRAELEAAGEQQRTRLRAEVERWREECAQSERRAELATLDVAAERDKVEALQQLLTHKVRAPGDSVIGDRSGRAGDGARLHAMAQCSLCGIGRLVGPQQAAGAW